MNNDELNYYGELFKALGHPTRLEMVMGMLYNDHCNVKDISNKLNMPQSTTSQHLSILKKAGIINYVKKGVETCYYVENIYVNKILKMI